MSKENVKMFFAELEKNPDLKAKYMSAMVEYQKESDKILSGKLIEIGGKAGFKFSDSDLHEARADLVDKAHENGELDDADLAAVAGGRANPGLIIASIITAGIACLAISLSFHGSCKQTFHTK